MWYHPATNLLKEKDLSQAMSFAPALDPSKNDIASQVSFSLRSPLLYTQISHRTITGLTRFFLFRLPASMVSA